MNYENLDDKTREYMLSEVNEDITKGRLYLSSRLSVSGRDFFRSYLPQVISSKTGDDKTLTDFLRPFFKISEIRFVNGLQREARVPSNAAEILAEGEFNKYYIRGLCRRAIDEGIKDVLVYRAKETTSRSPESESVLGILISPSALLKSMKDGHSLPECLGLSSRPSSLSIKLP